MVHSRCLHMIIIILLGIGIRCLLFSSPYREVFSDSLQVITPLTSMKRLNEAIWFDWKGKSPYSGSIYHNVPLYLYIFKWIWNQASNELIAKALFIVCDVLSAIVLFVMATILHGGEMKRDHSKTNNSTKCRSTINNANHLSSMGGEEVQHDHSMKSRSLSLSPQIISLLFILNPLSIISCVSQSTQVLQNTIVLICALCAIYGSIYLTSIFLALSIYLDPYLLVLFLPTCSLIRFKSAMVSSYTKTFFKLFASTLFHTLALLLLSFMILGGHSSDITDFSSHGWDFLDKTYGFLFKVQDLQPNIGIYWYFFSEVLSEFRPFFVMCFHYHLFLYPIPVSLQFRKHPFFAWWILLILSGALKAYPSIADSSISISLLPLMMHLLEYMTRTILLLEASIIVGALLPITFHAWIGTHRQNSNYYFGFNLGLMILYIFVIGHMITAVIKRDHLLENHDRHQKENKLKVE